MEREPFLWRYKKSCSSANLNIPAEVFYDDCENILLFTCPSGKVIPAIDSSVLLNLGTKKADIEKGEDQKDRM